jgi:uncharacterized protein
MPRPKCCRMISCAPDTTYYKPKGIPASALKEIVVTLDEFEALKLADFQQLYQEKAAEAMHISRQTFGRVIESAHYKIAWALSQGHAIRIEGGEISIRKKTFSTRKGCKKFIKNTENKHASDQCLCKERTSNSRSNNTGRT